MADSLTLNLTPGTRRALEHLLTFAYAWRTLRRQADG
jgi:hypothetical protein